MVLVVLAGALVLVGLINACGGIVGFLLLSPFLLLATVLAVLPFALALHYLGRFVRHLQRQYLIATTGNEWGIKFPDRDY